MNKTKKKIAISDTPIHQFFLKRNRFRSGASVTPTGCGFGAVSDFIGILNCARFRIRFTLG